MITQKKEYRLDYCRHYLRSIPLTGGPISCEATWISEEVRGLIKLLCQHDRQPEIISKHPQPGILSWKPSAIS